MNYNDLILQTIDKDVDADINIKNILYKFINMDITTTGHERDVIVIKDYKYVLKINKSFLKNFYLNQYMDGGNFIEYKNYKLIGQYYPDYLAKVIWISKDHSLLIQENVGDSLINYDLYTLKNKKMVIPYFFLSLDIDINNFGFANNKLVCIDYTTLFKLDDLIKPDIWFYQFIELLIKQKLYDYIYK